jgi:hypothetical protein
MSLMELETSGAGATRRYQHFFLFEIVLTSSMLTNFVILDICMHFLPLCNPHDAVLVVLLAMCKAGVRVLRTS